jgi:hypothetical protein
VPLAFRENAPNDVSGYTNVADIVRAYTLLTRVKAMRTVVFAWALTSLAACDGERILAIARDATRNPVDAGNDTVGTDAPMGPMLPTHPAATATSTTIWRVLTPITE